MKKNSIYVTKSSLPPYEEYIEMIRPMWDSHILTNMGVYHNRLEKELKDFLQVSHISLIVNGHIALEIALQAMNFPQGSEIITTPFTFISTTHAIIRSGMVPVFCDIKLDDFTIDEGKIESLITDKTVAILPVHVYGNICNFTAIDKIAKRNNLKVIYDAAHSFGESIDGVSVESLGDASVLSFHATKVFNTIEGGAVCFKEAELYEKLYYLKNFGICSEEVVEAVGANGKMNEFSAAMGLCNLKHIGEEIRKREENTLFYDERLSKVKDIILRKRDIRIKYNYGYYPVLFPSGEQRNEVYKRLKENDIHARKYFYPLTADQQCFHGKYQNINLKNARYAAERILVMPLYSELEEKEIDRICRLIYI